MIKSIQIIPFTEITPMKKLTQNAQPVIEMLITLFLLGIIITGSYKLYKKWTNPAESTKQNSKIHSVIDKPSKELCSFMMKQCRGRY